MQIIKKKGGDEIKKKSSQLIIMLIQFKFGHFLAENRAVLAI
jgi:hypothetical protein